MSLGHVKDCHDPRRDMCPHNADAKFNCDCISERVVVRKPYRVIKVTLRPEYVEGRINRRLVIEVHPDGLLRIREAKRRKIYDTNVGRVYRGCVWREAMLSAQVAAKKRKDRKKRRR